jgi:hypothetical protein
MSLRLLHFLLLLRLVAAQTATDHQEIFLLPAFSQQQLCVQECFTLDNGCVTDLVGSMLGCPINPCTLTDNSFGANDNCYCRGDLQGAAQSFLSSCVQESCTIGDTAANVATAINLYAGYCTSLGFTAYAANTGSTQTTPSLNTNLGTSGTTNRASVTETGSSSSNPTSSSGLPSTTTYIIIAVVGGCGFLILLAAATLAKKYRTLKQRQRQMSQWGGPYPNSMPMGSQNNSQHPLRFDHDVWPSDSASNVGGHVPPSYPHIVEPSLISTRM